MDNNRERERRLLVQAINLLRKVNKLGWNSSPGSQDLLTQEIDLFLRNFSPTKEKKNRYRQMDIDELIREILKDKDK